MNFEINYSRCIPYGLPINLGNTYDCLPYEKLGMNSFAGILHISSMLAAKKIAEKLYVEPQFIEAINTNIEIAKLKLKKFFYFKYNCIEIL